MACSTRDEHVDEQERHDVGELDRGFFVVRERGHPATRYAPEASAGAGLVQTYEFAVARELARGELVEVLASERGAARRFSLLYPKGVVQSSAIKKLVAFLVKR